MDNELIKELAQERRWAIYDMPIPPRREDKSPKAPWGINSSGIPQPTGWQKPENERDYKTAREIASHYHGARVGFVTSKNCYVVCVDCDHCLDPVTKQFKDDEAGRTARRIVEIITTVCGKTYIEVSPSGDGLHIWGKLEINSPGYNIPKNKKQGNKYIEIYSYNHFLTVTESPWGENNVPLAMIQPAIEKVIQEFHLKGSAPARAKATASDTPQTTATISTKRKEDIIEALGHIPPQDLSYDDWFKVGAALKHEGIPVSVWLEWSKQDPERCHPEEFPRKWESFKEENQGEPVTGNTIFDMAKGYGWKNRTYAAMKKEKKVIALEESLKKRLASGGEEEPEPVGKDISFLKMVREFKQNDSENADRLADWCKGKFMYCTDTETWLRWTGKKWEKLARGKTCVELQEPARLVIQHTALEFERRHIEFSENGGKLDDLTNTYTGILKYLNGKAQDNKAIQDCIKLAAGKPSIMCRSTDFDNTPNLLNCDNGVLDLETGELLPHNPAQRFMKCTRAAYDRKPHSTLWADTMRQIIPNEETRNYVQRLAGYCLYGDIKEEKIFFLKGGGGNGKGTFIETLGKALGDYSEPIPVEILLSSKMGRDGNAATPEIAKLKGIRLARSSEPKAGTFLNDGTLKLLTGKDVVTARRLYAESMKFSPTFKLVVSVNNMPAIKDITDEAIKRRIVNIPFNVHFDPKAEDGNKLNRNLKITLEKPENLADCLLWAYEGFKEWQKIGVDDDTYSREIAEENDTYYKENDYMGEFLDDCCSIGPEFWAASQNLYKCYRDYARANGTPSFSTKKGFNKALRKRLKNVIELKPETRNNTRGWRGIQVGIAAGRATLS